MPSANPRSTFQIRPAEPNEHKVLTEIAVMAKRSWKYPEHWIQQWTDTLTITADWIRSNVAYVLVEGDLILGFYGLRNLSRSECCLEHLWISQQRMRQGLGKILFHHAVSVARSASFSKMVIESDPNAEGFYAHLGAIRAGEMATEIDGRPRTIPVLHYSLLHD